jgi:AraC-like DNA-binding protein
MIRLESFSLSGYHQMAGHGHPTMHLCFVGRGGFEEKTGDTWQDCKSGTVRISPGHSTHNLWVRSTGARGLLIEFPDHFQGGLARPLTESRFLSGERYQLTASALVQSWKLGDRFEIECSALELAAASVSVSTGRAPAWLRELRAEISDNYKSPQSLARLAAKYERHRSHVARSFRTWFGRRIGDHLVSCRIHEAARLLRETDQPIIAIALELGFFDQAHFTRMFHREEGITPARYRAGLENAT